MADPNDGKRRRQFWFCVGALALAFYRDRNRKIMVSSTFDGLLLCSLLAATARLELMLLRHVIVGMSNACKCSLDPLYYLKLIYFLVNVIIPSRTERFSMSDVHQVK
jgi:hypothetical protein